MDHFEHFQGFAIQPGCRYVGFYRLRPVETARLILKENKGKTVEVCCDNPFDENSEPITLTVPNEDDSIDRLFGRNDSDYVWIQVEGGPLQIFQRMVIMSRYITQVEQKG